MWKELWQMFSFMDGFRDIYLCLTENRKKVAFKNLLKMTKRIKKLKTYR